MDSSFEVAPFSGGRQFSFGKAPNAIFLTENGVYFFISFSPLRLILPELPIFAVILLTRTAAAFNMITYNQAVTYLIIEFVALIAVGTVWVGLNIRRAKSMFPKEISLARLIQSDVKRDFYDWSQVHGATFGRRRSLSIFVGSGLKRRNILVHYEQGKGSELQLFLSEKLGERVKGSPG